MLCYACFREKEAEGPCPFCGYDPAGTARKFPLALRPGTILNGRYIVGRVLGQGGFGITYLALDDRTRARFAMKEYFPSEFAGRAYGGSAVQVHSENQRESFLYGKAQFLEEARTLAAVSGSENIVRIYSYFEENGTAYFAMEYVEGVSLDAYLRQKGGRLTAPEAEKLFLPLMGALETVHKKGIVHRDIAPDNIIVTPEGKAKLIDFGAARYSTGEKSRSLDVILKHGFAPYEQYMRRGRQGPWTDVYALAATFYYAVTGRVPPEAVERMQEDGLQRPSALGVNLGKGTEAVLLKALSVQAQDRWQSMGEFSGALQAAAMAEAEERKKAEQERKAREEHERKAREKAESAARKKAEREKAKTARRAEKKKNLLPLILAAAAVLSLVIFGATRLAGKPSPAVTAPPAETQAVEPPAGTAQIVERTETPAPMPEPTPPLFTVEENGLTFAVYEDHAEVSAADKTLRSAEVPGTVEGKPVTCIGNEAFARCALLSNIALPEGVTAVGCRAFSGCSALTGITLPEGLTEIKDEAFFECRRLQEITLPESLTDIGTAAFTFCSSLREITLPESLTDIGGHAFSSCSSLTGITLPEGVTGINDSTFYGCSSLQEITLSESLTFIGYNAFYRCSSLREIALPAGVTSIDSGAFFSCESLTGIALPEGLISIGSNAFSGCSSLQEIALPEGMTDIGEAAFSNCDSLSAITMPDGLTSIGYGAFAHCSSLTEITLPEGLTSIDNGAFSGCDHLTDITLPEGLTGIGSSAFYDCAKLTGITLPEGLTSIGDTAFYGCSSLEEIKLPESVTSIGNSTFYGCSSLREITLPTSVTDIGSHVFDTYQDGVYQPLNISIHAPAGSYAAEFFRDDPRLVIDG